MTGRDSVVPVVVDSLYFVLFIPRPKVPFPGWVPVGPTFDHATMCLIGGVWRTPSVDGCPPSPSVVLRFSGWSGLVCAPDSTVG